jgi:hypothetical protein
MKTTIELDESDIRAAVLSYLRVKYPAEVLTNFGSNPIQIKTTYRANETWRRPKHLRLLIERHSSLTS